MPHEMPVTPINYRITMEPDMVNFRFAARLELTAAASRDTDAVRLNSIDLSIARCMLVENDHTKNLPFRVDPDDEMLTIFLPAPLSGDFELVVDYYGEISDRMAGFYKSTYRRGDETHVIAVTQFQESDARRAFPCIDHPLYKASFEFVFIVDSHLTAITNTPAASESDLRNGKKQVVFQKTPKMSTYLLFFGIGEFNIHVDGLDRRVRAVVLPGMEPRVRYALAFARKSLHFCEKYYNIPYPLPKVDLIVVPDFAFGAMENWGAITFRENLLLYDPETTDAESEERICEVIAHEMAHQWFGNLVTPSDWRYLWLNESFATYFGFGVIDHYHPDWQIWDNFIENQLEPAMNRDALNDTIPIEIPGGDHVVINSSTAPIIYSKGGGVLRQMAGFTGEEAFADGLFRYLETHSYGCAKSADLWEALETASNQPVSRIMERWVTQSGHPLITATRTGDTLTLSQGRFSFLPRDDDDTVWPIPMVIRLWDQNGGQKTVARMFDTPTMTIDMAGMAAYNINDGHTGFYRSRYADAANWETLCRMIGNKTLSAADRHGMVSDRFALLKAGALGLTDFIEDLGHFDAEDDPLPLSRIFDSLFLLLTVLDETGRGPVRDALKGILEKTFDKTGHLPDEADNHGLLRLKNKMLWYGVLMDMETPARIAHEQFERLTAERPVSPDATRAALQAGAFLDGDKAFDWFVHRLEASPGELERQNIMRAMGCFSRPEMIDKAKAFILTDVPQRNMPLPVAWLAMNPYAKDTLWDWFTENRKRLEYIHPILFERIVTSVVPYCCPDRHEEITAALETLCREKPLFEPAIRMSLEQRAVYLRMRGIDASNNRNV